MIYGYDGLGHTVRSTYTIGWWHAVLFTKANKGNEYTRVGKNGLKPWSLRLSAYRMSGSRALGRPRDHLHERSSTSQGRACTFIRRLV